MRMADGHAERIGCVGTGQSFQQQESLHHILDLRFLRFALPDDGFFDLQRGVLVNVQVGGNESADGGTASLPKQ